MDEEDLWTDEPLALTPEQWVGLLSRDGAWLPHCCPSVSAAREALGGALREGGRLSRAAAEAVLCEVADHGGREGEGLRAILLGAAPGSGTIFWTARGSPWFEIGRACAALFGGADGAVERARESRAARMARERDVEARSRPGYAAELADLYAEELSKARSAKLLRPDERAFEELLRRGAVRPGLW